MPLTCVLYFKRACTWKPSCWLSETMITIQLIRLLCRHFTWQNLILKKWRQWWQTTRNDDELAASTPHETFCHEACFWSVPLQCPQRISSACPFDGLRRLTRWKAEVVVPSLGHSAAHIPHLCHIAEPMPSQLIRTAVHAIRQSSEVDRSSTCAVKQSTGLTYIYRKTEHDLST